MNMSSSEVFVKYKFDDVPPCGSDLMPGERVIVVVTVTADADAAAAAAPVSGTTISFSKSFLTSTLSLNDSIAFES